MTIKLINFGVKNMPVRQHSDDAGADVYTETDILVRPHETVSVPLGFGVVVPEGYTGLVLPRSSLAAKGINASSVPIDSGYRGEIHAIITNTKDEATLLPAGSRIAQLVIMPCVLADFEFATLYDSTSRGTGAFGSTGI